MKGRQAAQVFYGDSHFSRVSAMPITTLKLLQDFDSVQSLEDEAHRTRKQLFLSLFDPAESQGLAQTMVQIWRQRMSRLPPANRVVLFDEIRAVLTEAACRWAGLHLRPDELERRERELSAMVEGAGSLGPRSWRALWLRSRCERWAQQVVVRARAQSGGTREKSAVATVATFRDADGSLLNLQAAAVELLNVLRPIVAVARFIVFAAQALHEHPEQRQVLAARGEPYLEAFAQEVRRLCPFFPFIGGRARSDFDWRGHRFASGDWVLLDIYGTNRDPDIWDQPERFMPERFLDRPADAYDFIPQGGGPASSGHRCPGEGATVALVKAAVRELLDSISYEVPSQDLTIDLSRIPARPASGFVMAHVRLLPPA